MPQDFTLEDFNAALTQLPEYGGYGTVYPALTGLVNPSAENPSASFWANAFPEAYAANPGAFADVPLSPALSGLVNPQRNVAKMGPQDQLGGGFVAEGDLGAPTNNFDAFYGNSYLNPTAGRPVEKTFQGPIGSGQVLEGGFDPPGMSDANVDYLTPPALTPEEVASILPAQPGFVPVPDAEPTIPAVGTPMEVVDKTPPYVGPGDTLPPAPFPTAPPAFTLPSIEPPAGEEIPLPTSPSTGLPGGTGLPTEPDTNIQPTITASPAPPATPKGTSRMADIIDITKDIPDDTKVELEDVTNQANKLLTSKGWSDSGTWGYARTRNMLTGGGLGPVVTEGPMVPWQSQGRPQERQIDYISNVGGQDVFPSRLSEADRLKGSTGGEMAYVPEKQKATYLKENYDIKVEPHPVFNDSLGLTDADLKNLPGDLKNKQFFYRNVAENYDTFKSNVTSNSFADVKTADDAVGIFGKAGKFTEDAEKSFKTFMTDSLGLTDEFIAGLENFPAWLNKPLDAISTDKIGITPLDIMMVAAGGYAGFGAAIMNKVYPALFKPFKNAFKSIFKGTAEKFDSKEIDAIGTWEQSLGGASGDTAEERLLAQNTITEGKDKGLIMELAEDANGDPTYASFYDPETGNPMPFNQFNFPPFTEAVIVGGDGLYALTENGTVATKITTKDGEPASGSTWKGGKTSKYTNLKVHDLRGGAFGGGLHNKISLGSWGSDMVKKHEDQLPGG